MTSINTGVCLAGKGYKRGGVKAGGGSFKGGGSQSYTGKGIQKVASTMSITLGKTERKLCEKSFMPKFYC